MADSIWSFIMNVPQQLAPFTTWLFSELPYVHIAPIALFGIGGFTVILTLHLVHLVNLIGG